MFRRLRSFLPVLAGIAMMMGVVVANGRPSVFTDTDDYFVEGRTFAYTIAYALHIKTPPPPPTDPEDIADAKQAAADLRMSHTEIGARSPYYGLLLYVTQRIGTIWLTSLVQAAVGAWLTWLLWRAALPKAPRWSAYAMEAAVAFGSTLPFFASFTMPDVFSGYTAASAVLLIVYWDRLKISERFAVGLLLALAMTFHTSHVLNTATLVGLSVLLLLVFRIKDLKPLKAISAVILAMICAVGASVIYKEAVHIKTGDELRRPPFLAMRVIADGPGREYLRYACDHGATYVLCQFRHLPLDDSQDLLWSDDRKKGIFNVTTFENRLRMEREENKFVLNAVLYDPVGQVVASLENWGEQLTMVYLDDPLKNPHYYLTNDYWSTTNLPWLINHAADCGRDHWGCGPRLSMDASAWLHGGLFILAVILIGWRLIHRDMLERFKARRFDWDEDRTRLMMLMVLLVAAVIGNGFVCGALSGPFARYQARITWLVAAGAAVAMISLIPATGRVEIPTWMRRLWGLPMVQAVARRIDPAFIRFGMVGVAGFTVDALVLHAMTGLVGLTPVMGRFVSFPVAVLATWALNRTFTFKGPTAHKPLKQALVYAAVQGVGGAANIGAYTIALAAAPPLKHMLLIPLAIGSAAGLCLTFLGAKHIAFKAAAIDAPPAEAGILTVAKVELSNAANDSR
ncbi:MAG: GtrA family protein [Caulobacteraceae bacterium]|nr:GtrA family protein [Caulobacteraceae bacterium]